MTGTKVARFHIYDIISRLMTVRETLMASMVKWKFRTLPFGTWIVVENQTNGRRVKVRINDRGPFRSRRILDVSYAAARTLGAIGPGVIPIRLRVTGLPAATRVGEPSGSL